MRRMTTDFRPVSIRPVRLIRVLFQVLGRVLGDACRRPEARRCRRRQFRRGRLGDGRLVAPFEFYAVELADALADARESWDEQPEPPDAPGGGVPPDGERDD